MSLQKTPLKLTLFTILFLGFQLNPISAITDTVYQQITASCGQATFCLPINIIELQNYQIFLNGNNYSGGINVCDSGDSTQQDGVSIGVASGTNIIETIRLTDSVWTVYWVDVVESDGLEVSVQVEASTCNSNSGKIILTVEGGSGVYNYGWPNEITETDEHVAFNLAGGEYQIIVSDANEVTCFEVLTVVVEETIQGTAEIIISDAPEVCYGEESGYIVYDVNYDDDFLVPFTVKIYNVNNEPMNNGELAAGIYGIHLYDSTGCLVTSADVSINSREELGLTVATNHIFCEENTGSATVSISGGIGTEPFLYYWAYFDPEEETSQYFDTTVSAEMTNLLAGHYRILLRNSFGCEATKTFEIIEEACPDELVFLNAPKDETVSCDQIPETPDIEAYSPCDSGTIMTNYSEYEISGACDGNYFIVQNWSAIDGCGDSISHMRFVTVRDLHEPSFKNFPEDITVDLSVDGTIPAAWEPLAIDNCADSLVYEFEETVDSTNKGYLIIRTYKATDPCQNYVTQYQTITVTGGDVWPGDTDSSGVVDQYDLFNIGLGYGLKGPARVWATDQWMGQYAAPWKSVSPLNQVNFRHGDTNGDGTIDLMDVENVKKNWKGKTFFRNEQQPTTRSVLPASLEVASVDGNGQVRMRVIVGDEHNSQVSVYGVAMRFNYPKDVIVPNSIQLEVSDSWLGEAEDLLTIANEDYDSGALDFALVRTNQSDAIGTGHVAIITFQLQPDYQNQDFDAVFALTTGQGVDASGTALSTTAFEESLDITSGTQETLLSTDLLEVYPNPSSGQFTVRVPASVQVDHYTVYAVTGAIVLDVPAAQMRTSQIRLPQSTEGIYLLKATTPDGVIIKKISVAK